jgi:tRNA A22 N-methylase
MRAGQPRTDLVLSLVPPGSVPIDVGADHGYVAAALGAIATERRPHRRGRAAVRWVVADGLAPFRAVDVAIIAGMGAATIEGILDRGPRPRVAILHAPDDPQRLRGYLAANGWRIDDEGLAPEGNRFAEVIRAVAGHEPATGLELAYGPILLARGSRWLPAHLRHHRDHWARLADQLERRAPERAAAALERARFLTAALARWAAADDDRW